VSHLTYFATQSRKTPYVKPKNRPLPDMYGEAFLGAGGK
jgi:hypothetical protein